MIHAFEAWDNFYVIVGSSAAALTGLQFVVIALIADAERVSSSREIAAFGTPTVIHFCAALFVSAVMSAPWGSPGRAAIALGATGLAGFVYALIVIRRTRRQTGYQLVAEDWIWHVVLPLLAYAAMFAAALALRGTDSALFVLAAAVLLLVFIGIHNAWDTVTYIAVDLPNREGKKPSRRRQ